MTESFITRSLTLDEVMELYESNYFFLEIPSANRAVGIIVERTDTGLMITNTRAPEEYNQVTNYIGVEFDIFGEVPSPVTGGESRIQISSTHNSLILQISYNE